MQYMLTRPTTISDQEAFNAAWFGNATLAEMAITNSIRKLYGIKKSVCGTDDYNKMVCLYLYLYAAETWCPEGGGFLDVTEYEAIIMNIENLQRQCCGNVSLDSYSMSPEPSAQADEIGTFILAFQVSDAQVGLSEISNSNFKNVRVKVERGYIPIPRIPVADGQYSYSKALNSTAVVFSHPLVKDEYIEITTIPR